MSKMEAGSDGLYVALLIVMRLSPPIRVMEAARLPGSCQSQPRTFESLSSFAHSPLWHHPLWALALMSQLHNQKLQSRR